MVRERNEGRKSHSLTLPSYGAVSIDGDGMADPFHGATTLLLWLLLLVVMVIRQAILWAGPKEPHLPIPRCEPSPLTITTIPPPFPPLTTIPPPLPNITTTTTIGISGPAADLLLISVDGWMKGDNSGIYPPGQN